ncbi:MAG: RT0821/Lpp0805 family surface protein [Alphaproteobacteria bacterium]|nr:RT0821/Lpp0805 family surface protein [Alphaproteobacteria bacterium]
MSLAKLGIAVVCVAMLGACAQQDSGGIGTKTAVGAAGGAAGGGLIAAAAGGGAPAIAAGVIVGGLLGGAAGNMLDDQDKRTAQQTTQNSLESTPTGQASTWKNPDNGNSGTVTPTRTYTNAQGQNCREFQQTISVGGKIEQGYGTACRDANGNWRIVS